MSKRSCSVLHFRSSISIFKSLLSLFQIDDSISEMLLWSNLLFLKDVFLLFLFLVDSLIPSFLELPSKDNYQINAADNYLSIKVIMVST